MAAKKKKPTPQSRARAVFNRLSGQDQIRVSALQAQSGKSLVEAVRTVAGQKGAFTTEKPGRKLGVFSSGKGNIKSSKKRRRKK